MDENTKKIIKERFDALPKDIQEVILSSGYEETLLSIGNQYKLTVEQLGKLELETTLVMMGLTPTQDFEKELTQELKVDNIKGNQITKEINDKIFLKIRDLLKLMNTKEGEEPSLEENSEIKVEKTGEEIMKSAGIEIIPEKLELNGGQTNNGNNSNSILSQKMSSSVQSAVIKTEHTLDNITKNSNQTDSGVPKPKIDPYREIPN